MAKRRGSFENNSTNPTSLIVVFMDAIAIFDEIIVEGIGFYVILLEMPNYTFVTVCLLICVD